MAAATVSRRCSAHICSRGTYAWWGAAWPAKRWRASCGERATWSPSWSRAAMSAGSGCTTRGQTAACPAACTRASASSARGRPREAMGFSDFEFLPRDGAGRDPRRFPGHREVHCYLRDFCDAFGLMDVVRLNTRVLRVAINDPTSTATHQWAVRSVRYLGGTEDDAREEEEVFDAVVVATGQYSQPMLPSGIEGVGAWTRRQLHSHSYRTPEPFRGEAVVVVGCRDSGKDIALDLCRVARKVHLAASSEVAAPTPAVSKMLGNHGDVLRLHPQVRRLHADGRVSFADGSTVVVDTVIYCTGYGYWFPFLDTGGPVAVVSDPSGNRTCKTEDNTNWN